MADYSIISPSELFGFQFDRMAGQIRCAMPGIIQSFDAATQTASVLPAITMKVNLGDGLRQMPLPVIINVPLVLPFSQNAGLLLTLPVREGDECLLIFADRAIDNFIEFGGVQPTVATANEETSIPRSHSLTDAICIPGIISKPQAVPKYSAGNIELRDRERINYISLGPGGIEISDGAATWSMKGGKITANAPGGIEETSQSHIALNAPNILLNGNISGSSAGGSATFTVGTFSINADHVSLNEECE